MIKKHDELKARPFSYSGAANETQTKKMFL